MLGFIIGLVWHLVSVGNEKDFAETTISVHHFLFWWYVTTSILVFFTIPLCQSKEVTDEISAKFMRGLNHTQGQCFCAVLLGFVVSRFLLFTGLSFLRQSVLIEEAVKTNKFAVGASLVLLGAMMGISSMFPFMAKASLQNK
ncbi:MAG: hypothetical protein AAB635_01600 [Patescibacteria group bacterium]